MSVPATTVDVATIGTSPDQIAAGNLQVVLSNIHGTAVYAAGAAGAAEYKADQANTRLDAVEGQASDASTTAYAAKGQLDGYVAPLVGKLDSEMDQIFTALNITRS